MIIIKSECTDEEFSQVADAAIQGCVLRVSFNSWNPLNTLVCFFLSLSLNPQLGIGKSLFVNDKTTTAYKASQVIEWPQRGTTRCVARACLEVFGGFEYGDSTHLFCLSPLHCLSPPPVTRPCLSAPAGENRRVQTAPQPHPSERGQHNYILHMTALFGSLLHLQFIL